MSLALSNLPALAAPANGTYVIYNRVLSPTGDKLALSYNGENQYVTAEPLKVAQNQLWYLSNYDATQQILSPKGHSALAAAWGNEGVTVYSGAIYTWAFQSGGAGYTIRDAKTHGSGWALKNQTTGSKIAIVAADDHAIQQKWVLEKQD